MINLVLNNFSFAVMQLNVSKFEVNMVVLHDSYSIFDNMGAQCLKSVVKPEINV